MANETEVFGVKNAVDRFKYYNTPSHAIFQGNEMFYRHIGDDMDEAVQVFAANISSIDPESRGRYMVKFYEIEDPEKARITNKTDHIGMFRFKVSDREQMIIPANGARMSGNGLSFGDQRWIQFLESEVERLKGEKEELEYELQEFRENEGKEENKLGTMGMIGELGNQYPWMQEPIMKILDIFNRLAPGAAQPSANGHTGSVKVDPKTESENQEVFQAAIKKMHAYYVQTSGPIEGDKQFASDMAKLANLTDKPAIFNMAISQLRTL